MPGYDQVLLVRCREFINSVLIPGLRRLAHFEVFFQSGNLVLMTMG